MTLTFSTDFPTATLAQASAESALSDKISRLDEEDDRYWDLRSAAAESYVISVFSAFAHEACEAVRFGQLPPGQISAVVGEFTQRLALHVRDDFEGPLFGSPDPHMGRNYGANGLDEVRAVIEGSPEWHGYLKEKLDAIETASRSTQTPPVNSEFPWQNVTIRFTSDHQVQITIGDQRLDAKSYEDLGFANKRTGLPNRAWAMLRLLATKGGTLADLPSGQWSQKRKQARKVIEELRKILRDCVRATADPVPFKKGIGWKTAFRIELESASD